MNRTIRFSKRDIYAALVFLAIYCSHDTLLFGTNADGRFVLIRKAVPFLLLICLLLLNHNFQISKEALCACLVILVLPIASCVVNGEDTNNYIYRAAIMFSALLFLLVGKRNEFMDLFNKILYLLSIWAIASYAIRLILPQLVSLFPRVINTAGQTFYFMGLSNVNRSLHYGMVRSMGIFREPGVFSVMLTIALINEMVVLKKCRFKYVMAYTVAMVTTFSTAGFLILVGIYTYYLLIERKIKHKGWYIFLIFVAVAVIGTQTDLLSKDGAIFDKFVKGSNSYGSWLARVLSITQSISIALDNPLFGIGRYALYDTVLGKTGVYRTVDNTNTILIGFAAYGIVYGVMTLWGCWRFVRKNCPGFIGSAILFLSLMMALSNEDFGQNILYYYIVFDGLNLPFGSEKSYQETNERL